MGNTSSDTAVYALDPFVGAVPLHEDDVLFDEMLSARIGAEHVSHTDEVLESLCSQLYANNPTTRNFQKLLRVVLRKTRALGALTDSELSEEGPAAVLANTLFVARVFLRALIQSTPDVYEMHEAHLMMPGEVLDDEHGGLVGDLFRALVDVLIDVPRCAATLPLLTEACLLCQTLLCVQMFCPLDETPVSLLAPTLCSRYRHDRLTLALLHHHMYSPAPAPAVAEEDRVGSAAAGGAATAAGGADGAPRRWAVLQGVLYLPRQLLALLFSSGGPGRPAPCLHSASLCLLLILCQHLPAHLQGRAPAAGARGPVALALSCLEDDVASAQQAHAPHLASAARSGGGEGEAEAQAGGDLEGRGAHGPAVSFPRLLDCLCAQLPAEPAVLLLYTLLHNNRAFLRYTLSRTDADVLLLPLLRGIYAAAAAPRAATPPPLPARTYMLLIVLLMLSQDKALLDSAFALHLPRVPWFKERLLGRISVGSLTVCVLCRLVQSDLSGALGKGTGRDSFIGSNCAAILANSAAAQVDVHCHAARSLVSLYARLGRRHAKLGQRCALLRAQAAQTGAAADGQLSEAEGELEANVDLMRTLLETMQAALSRNLGRNLHLVYALLERQQLFNSGPQPQRGGAAAGSAACPPAELEEPLHNLRVILAFFAPKIVSMAPASSGASAAEDAVLPTTQREASALADEAAAASGARTADEAMRALEAAAKEWTPALLRPRPELRFSYAQEANAEEFFTPYMWALVSETMSLVETAQEAAVGERDLPADSPTASPAPSPRPSFSPRTIASELSPAAGLNGGGACSVHV